MIVWIIFLTIVSLMEAVFLSSGWLLMILTARSFLVSDRSNFILAFSFGLLLSYLQGLPLGSLSLVYLTVIWAASILKRLSIVSHYLAMLPFAAALVAAAQLLQGLIFGHTLEISLLIPQIICLLPVYIAVKLWEERFIPRKEIRLKMSTRS